MVGASASLLLGLDPSLKLESKDDRKGSVEKKSSENGMHVAIERCMRGNRRR